jgi:formylglycine-generating enzyme required for sulfatase activity
MSPHYAAPEVAEGRFAQQSDQYSLAATYYELRTGRPVFEGENVLQIIYAHARNVPDLLGLPEAERLVVARALTKRPEDRWPTCRAFVHGLEGVAAIDNGRDSRPRGRWRAIIVKGFERVLGRRNIAHPVADSQDEAVGGLPPVPITRAGSLIEATTKLPDAPAFQPSTTDVVVVQVDRPLPGAPKVITNSLGMKLVLIPEGEFLMGSPDSDKDAYTDEKPQHRVRITRPFYLGVYEVTQGQYRAITGENPSYCNGSDDLPVERVSWNAAIAFCNTLSAKEGLKPYYQPDGRIQPGGEGYRLPTEAEWEYACRAGSTTRYSSGDDQWELGAFAWFRGNTDGTTHPVGQKRPNAWGLYDMHGNVSEWCWDANDVDYYKNSQGEDPVNPSQAAARVFRGGDWWHDQRTSRSACRCGHLRERGDQSIGFRPARDHSDHREGGGAQSDQNRDHH